MPIFIEICRNPSKFMTRLYPKWRAFGLYQTHRLKLDHRYTSSPELQVNPKRVDFFIANPMQCSMGVKNFLLKNWSASYLPPYKMYLWRLAYTWAFSRVSVLAWKDRDTLIEQSWYSMRAGQLVETFIFFCSSVLSTWLGISADLVIPLLESESSIPKSRMTFFNLNNYRF